jgi:PPOX class probable F420-dependent enzyme
MNIASDTLHQLLDRWPVAHLASVTPAGCAHVIPIVFVRDEDALVTPIDGKRKDGRPLQRLRNLNVNPSVEVSLDAYDHNWEKLWWVRLVAIAREIELTPRLETMFRRKYPQYETLGDGALSSTAIAVRWARVAAWAQSDDDRVIRQAVAERSAS